MGLETVCTVLYDGEAFEPKVQLETEALVFRGALKKTIPFREITALRAEDDAISFVHQGSMVEARVGPRAAVWVDKIQNPKSLIDKLGVKQGDSVWVVNVEDERFREQLSDRTANIHLTPPTNPVSWIFYQADECRDLDRLAELRERLTPAGAVWVLHPKRRKDIQDLHVFAAAKEAGLVDVKVVAFSAEYSGLKLVIPRELRK
jgi:hypothetical protein